VSDAGFHGGIVEDDNSNVVYVLVGPPIASGCGVVRPRGFVVSQDARAVVVRVAGTVGAPGTSFHPYRPSYCGGETLKLPVRLDAPLGRRALYRSVDGERQFLVHPNSRPTLTYLPAGFTYAGAALGFYDPVGGGYSGTGTWGVAERNYVGPPGSDAITLTVRVMPLSGITDLSRARSVGSVNGHRAFLQDHSNFLWWRESADLGVGVGVAQRFSPIRHNQRPLLPLKELMKIARGIR
jgi:hypothetical protein